jgi:hypothetical protein
MSGLNNIPMGPEARRRLLKPLELMTPQEVHDAVQAVTVESENGEEAFALGHSDLDFRDLGRRRAHARQAVASMAADDAEAALRAVVAFWDKT